MDGTTGGLAHDHVQANLVALPERHASDFRRFCARNPKACPVLEIGRAGRALTGDVARDADLRTDLPRYCVFEHGELVDEPSDASSYWRDDLVAFLLGCSMTFEYALIAAGVPVRHLEAGTVCPAYMTSWRCRPSGPFAGPLVVTMRAVAADLVPLAIAVSARFPHAHGTPVAVGDPEAMGIAELDDVDFGDPPQMRAGDVPLFWACGVTPQLVAREARLDLMITHAPGHMLVTDQPAKQ